MMDTEFKSMKKRVEAIWGKSDQKKHKDLLEDIQTGPWTPEQISELVNTRPPGLTTGYAGDMADELERKLMRIREDRIRRLPGEESIIQRIPLESEQKELLRQFVDADRKVPRGKERTFLALEDEMSGCTFVHLTEDGIQVRGDRTDADILVHKGLLGHSGAPKGGEHFYVMPEGVQYYRQLMQLAPPMETVESEIVRHLSSDEFGRLYRTPFEKWSDAAALLWGSDSQKQFTTIGHLCREALQIFTDMQVNKYKPSEIDLVKSHTANRLRSVIESCKSRLGSREREFLDALVDYWQAVSNLAHRQEHGAEREGGSLKWEDSRRVVFQTCIVMYEIDRALSREV